MRLLGSWVSRNPRLQIEVTTAVIGKTEKKMSFKSSSSA
jgi:hypothetical protein